MSEPWTDAQAAIADRMRGGDFVSVRQFSPEELLTLLDITERYEQLTEPLLQGQVLACLFFEPSTRTRLSFESAMVRMGGSCIGFASAHTSSASKGESLADTIKMAEQYCDVMVVRHPYAGAARLAAQSTSRPVINGGDGANQHPSQTLLDLYTIRQRCSRLHGLRVGFLGDLKYGRAAHGIIEAVSMLDNELVLISPQSLRLPPSRREELDDRGVKWSEQSDLQESIADLDVLYVTRIQQERFGDPLQYERVKSAYQVDPATLEAASERMIVLHPLPRVQEIDRRVDASPRAAYFDQARNGVTVRKALLSLLLGRLPS